MPIRFRCQRCNQLLGIASRKAGSRIECPRCGLAQLVPSQGGATTPNPDDASIFGEQPAAIDSTASTLGTMPPSRAEQPDRPLPSGMILYPRRTLYIQALLFLVLGVVAFAAGYYIGRGDAGHQRQVAREQAASKRVLVEGKLLYRRANGPSVGDEHAVAIVLPAGKTPSQTLLIDGLRPQDPPPPEHHANVEAIRQAGGGYARADAGGNFSLVVPERGTYWILLISAHAVRPNNSPIAPGEMAEIRRYFPMAEPLVNRFRYRWSAADVQIGFNPIELDFGK